MYQDLLIEPSADGIEFAASILRNGGIVAFPTETVYGLGGNALDSNAVKSIFVAKGRPLTDPLIVHVINKAAAELLLEISPDERLAFDILSDSFWPGPLTIIAKAASCIPSAVTAETGFVGIRCPAHPLAVALLECCQLPIAAPSANRFAHVSPTRAHHVLSDLGDKGVRVLNGDNDSKYAINTCLHGIESSVVRINATEKSFQIFRQGAVTKLDIEEAIRARKVATGEDLLWRVEVVNRVVKMHSSALEGSPNTCDDTISSTGVGAENTADIGRSGEIAPGQAVTHYSPDIPCVLVRDLSSDPSASTDSYILMQDWLATGCENKSIVDQVIVADVGSLSSYGIVVVDFGGKLSALAPFALAYRDLSPSGNSVEAARNLFDCLRWAELVPNARKVLIAEVGSEAQSLDESDRLILGLADRAYRSASGVSISVVLINK